MQNETFAKALMVAVWLGFAILIVGMIAGALLSAPPAAVPVACVQEGLLHPGPTYPEIGRAF